MIRCDEVIKDASGAIVELRARVDLDTLGRNPEGRKVKGVIHWVSARSMAVPAEVRLYDRLFSVPDAGRGRGRLSHRDQSRLAAGTDRLSASSRRCAMSQPGERFQFEREGYFVADPDSTPGRPVFNLTVGLRDTWGKVQQ